MFLFLFSFFLSRCYFSRWGRGGDQQAIVSGGAGGVPGDPPPAGDDVWVWVVVEINAWLTCDLLRQQLYQSM